MKFDFDWVTEAIFLYINSIEGLETIKDLRCGVFEGHYLQRTRVDGLINLLISQRMKRGHGHIEQRERPLERRLRGEAHVALQQIHLRQVDWNHLWKKGERV